MSLSSFSSSSLLFEYESQSDHDETLDENGLSTNLNDQCAASYRWISDNSCNLKVRVDNPCNQTAYFYITVNNCNQNCVRCYYVNPGAFVIETMTACQGAQFFWGPCPY